MCNRSPFQNLRIKKNRVELVTITARTSATGSEAHTPFSPKRGGNTSTAGIKTELVW